MIDLQKLVATIGKRAIVQHDQLSFEVEVKNVRLQGSRVEYLVAPVTGSGERWTGSLMLSRMD